MVFKKIWDFFLLSNGISTGEDEPQDKWAKFRAEREEWEHERNLERAAPVEREDKDAAPHQ